MSLKIISRSITEKRFVVIDKLGTVDDWNTLKRYRTKLAFMDDAQEGFTVSARALHKALGSKQQFTHWITARLEQEYAALDTDYQVDKVISVINQKAGSSREIEQDDYLMTPDLSKRLSMREGTDVGRIVRKYFVLCERIAKKFALFNATRAEAFTALDKRLKHWCFKTQAHAEDIKDRQRHICMAITGITPRDWEAEFGQRPRDFLPMTAKLVYLQGFEFVLNNLEADVSYNNAVTLLHKHPRFKIKPKDYRIGY